MNVMNMARSYVYGQFLKSEGHGEVDCLTSPIYVEFHNIPEIDLLMSISLNLKYNPHKNSGNIKYNPHKNSSNIKEWLLLITCQAS